MPRRPRSHQLEEESLLAFRGAIPTRWICREQRPDYGLDGEVELVDEADRATGVTFKFQLKATDTLGPRALSIVIPVEHYRYYEGARFPILLVRYVAGEQALYTRWLEDFSLPSVAAQQQQVTLRFTSSDRWSDSTPSSIERRLERMPLYRSHGLLVIRDVAAGRLHSEGDTLEREAWHDFLATLQSHERSQAATSAEATGLPQDANADREVAMRLVRAVDLQKRGWLHQAQNEILMARRRRLDEPLLRFDLGFYEAKARLQAGAHAPRSEMPGLAEGFATTIGQLQRINTDVEANEFLVRWASLLWRQGYALLMAEADHLRESRRAFDAYRDVASQAANQRAIYAIFGLAIPHILSSGLTGARHAIEEAIGHTSAYDVVDLDSRFTHPQVALAQRDLLYAAALYSVRDRRGGYEAIFRAASTLRRAAATTEAEGVAELLAAIKPYTEDIPDLFAIAMRESNPTRALIEIAGIAADGSSAARAYSVVREAGS
jgi:hypothetical protein